MKDLFELPFQDRIETCHLLGAKLTSQNLTSAVVLALPWGGLPVVEALKAPIAVIVVRKLGVAWQTELAMGAIACGTRVLDNEVIDNLVTSLKQI
jgi:putative phosphoribosyl transferase